MNKSQFYSRRALGQAFLTIAIPITFFLSGCNYISAGEVQSWVDSELKVGDSREKIEEFYIRHKFDFGYDETFNTYYAIKDRDKFISVFCDIKLDDNERFLSVSIGNEAK